MPPASNVVKQAICRETVAALTTDRMRRDTESDTIDMEPMEVTRLVAAASGIREMMLICEL